LQIVHLATIVHSRLVLFIAVISP